MKSWTRTLNLDDAHTLLALAEPGMALSDWSTQSNEALPHLSVPRRRELIRMIRDGFLDIGEDGEILRGLFLTHYESSAAMAQLDLVSAQWALSHPITLIAVEELIAPALQRGELDIPLADVETLVAKHVETNSAESLRKTRTVLLGALEGIGVLTTRGTGQYRSLRASRGEMHPAAFGYLALRDLADRQVDSMMAAELHESSLGTKLTQCTLPYATQCVEWNIARGILEAYEDEIGRPRSSA